MRLRFGDCVLDSETRQLLVRGEEVHLQRKAFELLSLLLHARPKAISKETIHEQLWPGTFVSDSTVTSLLADLRKAIEDSAEDPRFIRTVHRFGYAFCGSAEEASGRQSPLTRRQFTHWLLRGRRRIPLKPGETIIGRDPDVTVSIADPTVSRRHARIVVADDVATLEDLGSMNGTFVADKRVTVSKKLADGDRLKVGSVNLTVRIVAVPESTAAV